MFTFIQNLKTKRNVRRLVSSGTLTPVTSFEAYTQTVRAAKKNSPSPLFTNCYMLPDEIKRLIDVKLFYRLKSDNGVAFVSDEGGYYYLFLFLDLDKPLSLSPLDRNMMAENVFYEARKNEKQTAFEALLQRSGFQYLNTYKEITNRPQITPEKYWSSLKALEKSLEAEGKRIAVPKYSQLRQFEKIYRSQIDRYSQKRYTKRERKKQADMGLLRCITDKSDEVYAIIISGSLHGGAIAAREDCKNNAYAPVLTFTDFQYYYENMPDDPEERKKYVKENKGSHGWIAIDNKPSIRLHKALGLVPTGKAVSQFVMQGFSK